jgi:hypothetical protein
MSPNDLKGVSDEGLRELARDAFYRIGTHTAGEYPSDTYLEQQRSIIAMIREEFTRRDV